MLKEAACHDEKEPRRQRFSTSHIDSAAASCTAATLCRFLIAVIITAGFGFITTFDDACSSGEDAEFTLFTITAIAF